MTSKTFLEGLESLGLKSRPVTKAEVEAFKEVGEQIVEYAQQREKEKIIEQREMLNIPMF